MLQSHAQHNSMTADELTEKNWEAETAGKSVFIRLQLRKVQEKALWAERYRRRLA